MFSHFVEMLKDNTNFFIWKFVLGFSQTNLKKFSRKFQNSGPSIPMEGKEIKPPYFAFSSVISRSTFLHGERKSPDAEKQSTQTIQKRQLKLSETLFWVLSEDLQLKHIITAKCVLNIVPTVFENILQKICNSFCNQFFCWNMCKFLKKKCYFLPYI